MQCNPYSTWIEWAHGCQYHAVFAPLDRSAGEELMDMDKAWELVDRLVGLDYGYKVVVSGWLDTIRDNLPCPGGKEQNLCLEPEHFELLFHFAEKLSPVVAQVFVPMIQQRVGVPFNTTLLQAYHQAALSKNLDPIDLSAFLRRLAGFMRLPEMVILLWVNQWSVMILFAMFGRQEGCSRERM